MTPPSIYEAQPLETPETIIVISTSFIRQEIDIRIHEVMYQVSKKLANIVKHVVYNEFQQQKDLV